MEITSMHWIGFNLFILFLLTLDLGVFHRKSHTVSVKEATIWSGVWIALALLFNWGVYQWMGSEKGLQFLTGYLIEKSLSVDNIFIFILIFGHFKVPSEYQHKVLFWGILGALIMRAILIVVGATLIAKFHWILYLFGGFLVLTGLKMAFQKEEHHDMDQHPAVKLVRRFMPIVPYYAGDKFWTRLEGKLHATPLLLVLVIVEMTDLIFAVDSIPAIFAITTDPFIVYTSNVFAILGLRSLYFALNGVMSKFHYLKVALAVILCFVGVKMLMMDFWKIPVQLSLGFIAGVLAIAVVASLLRTDRLEKQPEA